MTGTTHTNSSLNYAPCRYGASKALFRGPAREIEGDYLAVLGGTETFGRFIETPYPALLEAATGRMTVNLGCMQAGIDAVLSTSMTEICSGAQATVLQILGAPTLSNRFYTVDPRNNERFLRASKSFKALYPEVDFGAFDRVDHMLTALARLDADRLSRLRQEVQTAWVARMRTLLGQIEGPKVLLWLSDHAPYSKATGGTICRDPLFVDRAMLNALQDHADALVEVVATPEEIAQGRSRMVFDAFDQAAAQQMLGPVVHDRAVEALTPVLADLVGPFTRPVPAPHPSADDTLRADISAILKSAA